MINKKRLDEVLNYNVDTGIFTWKESTGSKIKGSIAGTTQKEGYIEISVDGVKYLAHRLVFLTQNGALPVNDVDHINCIKNDNRANNLREATNSLNQQNKFTARKDNSSSLIGVGFHKATNKFRARITLNKVQIHLGLFDEKHEAHQAYVKAKREMHEFCTI